MRNKLACLRSFAFGLARNTVLIWAESCCLAADMITGTARIALTLTSIGTVLLATMTTLAETKDLVGMVKLLYMDFSVTAARLSLLRLG